MNNIDGEITDFYQSLSSFGYSDLTTAIQKFDEVGLDGSKLGEMVNDYVSEQGCGMDEVDVCAVAYEHILQQARNEIDSVLGFDICSETNFCTAGNYMCTSFDYTDDDVEQLTKRIRKATDDQRQTLQDNEFVRVFLEDVDIELET